MKFLCIGFVALLMLAVPGLGQTVTAADLNQVTQGFQTDVAKLTKAVLDLRAGQTAQNESIETLCEDAEVVPVVVEEEPQSGVEVEADAESVVNGVVGNTSDRVSVKATGGAVVSIVVGQGGTAQKSEQDSSATTNNDVLPTARPVVEQEAYFLGGSDPSQEQSAYSAAEADSESESASGAMSESSAGVVFAPNINVSAANYAGQEIPVIDATSGVDDSNAPNSWSWDGAGVQVTYLQHPQSVETISRGSLGLVSYPISSDVQENVAYDEVSFGDGGSQIVLPTADGNVAVFQNGWIVYDNPISALSAISQGRQVVGIERHL